MQYYLLGHLKAQPFYVDNPKQVLQMDGCLTNRPLEGRPTIDNWYLYATSDYKLTRI